MKNILFKRGNKQSVDNYQGKEGELFIDLESMSLRLGNNQKGGVELPNIQKVLDLIKDSKTTLNDDESFEIDTDYYLEHTEESE